MPAWHRRKSAEKPAKSSPEKKTAPPILTVQEQTSCLRA
jgi:hypothetical protein